MRSPSFTPERAEQGFSWLSIGTGATHELAEEYATQDLETFVIHGQGEVANRGGTAFSVAGDVARGLAENPIAAVSGQLQVGTVWPDRHDIRTLRGEQHGPAWSSWTLVEPQGLATSWDEFQRLCQAADLEAAVART